VAAHWANGLQGRVSYTFSKAEDSAGNRLLNSPEHLAKFNLAMPVWRKNVFASVELQAMSSRKTVQGGRVDAFCIANATLFSRELVKNLEVSASVYNLFDQHYSDPVTADFTQDTIQQDGRSFRLKLTYRF
jgi:iron complex outermembrane receptor protein